MSIVSHKLSYSHDEVDELLSKIRAGKVLTDKDYEHLLKIGVTNLSTFSGNYDDLINKPDLRQVIMDILNENTIETTDSVQVKIQQLVASFNAHYQKIDNGLRKDMAVLEIELYEFLREAIIEQNEYLAALVEEWCVALAVDLENALNDKLIQHENEYDAKIQRILDVIEEPPIYTKPTLSLSVSSNKLEHNITKKVRITPSFTAHDAGEIVSYTLKRGQTILAQSSGITSYEDEITLSHGSTVTYVAVLEYGDGPIKNSNLDEPYPDTSIKAGQITSRVDVNAYAYSYYGVIDTEDVTEADIINMTRTLNTNKNYSAIYTLNNNQRSVFMYPSSYGELSSIKDANNFDYINSYKLVKMMHNEVEYNVYILKDPVKINGFKQIFA